MNEASDFMYYFSPERFERYLKACGGNYAMAEQLYAANGRLSSQFRILLTDFFEVFLRNALNRKLAEYFESSQWLLKYYEQLPAVRNKHKITTIKKRYNRKGNKLTNGDIVASMTLGFWTELFLSNSYKDLGGRPIQIFTNRPQGFTRSKAYNSLNKIRIFRNRIMHGEPILFKRNQAVVDLYYAEHIYQEVYKVLDWLKPSLVMKVKTKERVLDEIENIKKDFR